MFQSEVLHIDDENSRDKWYNKKYFKCIEAPKIVLPCEQILEGKI